ncbi:MAG: hypothetical protein ACI8TA_003084 [Cyclobacteriaceae bacterium]|jgi:hypothetical protein
MRQGKFLFIIIIVLLASCKVSKVATTNSPITDEKDTIETPKPVYFITQKGDTFESLDLEVDIQISRILPDTISIAAVGDIMMGTHFPDKSYLPTNNGKFLWNDSREILKNADITFSNLEGTVLNGEGNPKGMQKVETTDCT